MIGRSPEITILLPSYQRAEKLALTLESLKQQTFTNFRVVVCDNASTDDTPEVVAAAMRDDPRIEYVRREENIGVQTNYVRSIESVRTPYFIFSADDDRVRSDFLERTHQALAARPEAAFCAGFVSIERRGVPSQISPPGHPAGEFAPEQGYCRLLQRHITWTSMLFRTEHVMRAGGLRLETHPYLEVDLQLRLAIAHPYVFITEVFASWDADSSSKTRRKYLLYFDAVLCMLAGYLQDSRLTPAMRQATLRWGRRELGKWAKAAMNNGEADFALLDTRLSGQLHGRRLPGVNTGWLLLRLRVLLKVVALKLGFKKKLHLR